MTAIIAAVQTAAHILVWMASIVSFRLASRASCLCRRARLADTSSVALYSPLSTSFVGTFWYFRRDGCGTLLSYDIFCLVSWIIKGVGWWRLNNQKEVGVVPAHDDGKIMWRGNGDCLIRWVLHSSRRYGNTKLIVYTMHWGGWGSREQRGCLHFTSGRSCL